MAYPKAVVVVQFDPLTMICTPFAVVRPDPPPKPTPRVAVSGRLWAKFVSVPAASVAMTTGALLVSSNNTPVQVAAEPVATMSKLVTLIVRPETPTSGIHVPALTEATVHVPTVVLLTGLPKIVVLKAGLRSVVTPDTFATKLPPVPMVSAAVNDCAVPSDATVSVTAGSVSV